MKVLSQSLLIGSICATVITLVLYGLHRAGKPRDRMPEEMAIIKLASLITAGLWSLTLAMQMIAPVWARS